MFNRRSKTPHSSTDAEQDFDLQSAAGDITDAFKDHDMKHLASLSPEQRAIQTEARRKLYEHIDHVSKNGPAIEGSPRGRCPGGVRSEASYRTRVGRVGHDTYAGREWAEGRHRVPPSLTSGGWDGR
jgi:hypothetical protein